MRRRRPAGQDAFAVLIAAASVGQHVAEEADPAPKAQNAIDNRCGAVEFHAGGAAGVGFGQSAEMRIASGQAQRIIHHTGRRGKGITLRRDAHPDPGRIHNPGIEFGHLIEIQAINADISCRRG
jgi:ribosomal protein L37E